MTAAPCVTPRFWRWPEWDANSYYFNSQTAIGGSSSLRLRAFYSDFFNRQEMFDDASYSTMNLNPSSGVFANDDHSAGVSGQLETRRFARHEVGASFFVKHDTHTEQTTTVARTNVVAITPEQTDRDRQSSFGLQDAIELTSRLRATVGFSADRLEPLEAQDLSGDRLSVVPFALGGSVVTWSLPVAPGSRARRRLRGRRRAR